MIGQTGGHRRGAAMPAAIVAAYPKRSNGPAEVVRVHGEVGHGLMDIPVLREAVGLADLSAIAVAVRAIVPFDEGGMDKNLQSKQDTRRDSCFGIREAFTL